MTKYNFTIPINTTKQQLQAVLPPELIKEFENHKTKLGTLRNMVEPFLQAHIPHCNEVQFNITCNPERITTEITYQNANEPHAYLEFYIQNSASDKKKFYLEHTEIAQHQSGKSGILYNALRNFWQGNENLKNVPLERTAQGIGAYTWLKYGTVPDTQSWEELKYDIKKRISYDSVNEILSISVDCNTLLADLIGDPTLKGKAIQIATCSLTQDEYHALDALLNSNNPRCATIISDLDIKTQMNEQCKGLLSIRPETLGKALLCNTGWSGQIDPANKRQMKRFNRYTDQQMQKALGI